MQVAIYTHLKGGRPFALSEQSCRSDDRCREKPVTATSSLSEDEVK